MTDPAQQPGPAEEHGPVVVRVADLPVRRDGPTARTLAAGGAAWTVALLDVERPGAMPAPAGAERVLTVVDGELLALDVGGREQALERHRPLRLPADVPTAAALPTGPVRVLEVVAAQKAVRAHVVVLELSRKRSHPVLADQIAVLLSGRARVAAGAAETELGTYDAVHGARSRPPELTGRGFLAVVSLDPLPPD